jgi:hypothetical protein
MTRSLPSISQVFVAGSAEQVVIRADDDPDTPVARLRKFVVDCHQLVSFDGFQLRRAQKSRDLLRAAGHLAFFNQGAVGRQSE